MLSDALIKTGHRRHPERELSRRFSEAVAGGVPLAVVAVDADELKTLNDTRGCLAGDAVLVEVARRIVDHVGETGSVSRHAGDGFIVVPPGQRKSEAARPAEDLRRAIIAEPVDLRHASCRIKETNVVASLGAAEMDADSLAASGRPDVLLHAAGGALPAAKCAG
ncbi:MAG: GGDEF domain-containing protein [Phycisphaerales bacterium]|nr:MAG: GGDEF domain-containing protein [Phycisphaerales bacterium]